MKREAIDLRPATLQDADVLLAWRNDPETRRASHNTDLIQPEEHLAWLRRTLLNPDQRLIIAQENGIPVGTARASLSDGVYELSWTVAPFARARGVAKRMVAAVASGISAPIRAEIKDGNEASVGIAEHIGMTFDRRVGSVLHYSRPALDK